MWKNVEKDASPIFPSAIQLRTILLMENRSYIIHDILENGVNVIQRIVLHLGKKFPSANFSLKSLGIVQNHSNAKNMEEFANNKTQ